MIFATDKVIAAKPQALRGFLKGWLQTIAFMIHPNQHLPETGYLLCGEPVLLTAHGAEPLTQRRSALVEIGL